MLIMVLVAIVLRWVSIVMLHGYCNADYGAGGFSSEVDEYSNAACLLPC